MWRIIIRSALVALAGLLAASAGWLVVRDQAEVYERTLTFVLLPGTNLSDAQIPDAVRGLSQQDAQLVNTIGGAIGSDLFLQPALRRAGATALSAYSARSFRRPGSDIVELRLRGPDPQLLEAVAERHRTLATSWVGSVYRAYRLEFLEEDVAPGPVEPRVGETVALAFLLGIFLGGAAVFVEWKARQQLRVRPAAPREVAAPAAERDLEGRAVRTGSISIPRRDPGGGSGSGTTPLRP